jgi:hypothetical protein
MNTSRLHRARRYCALSVCLSAFLASGRAQQVTQAPTPAQLAKYDVNKNGVLDPNELAAMQADETKATKAAVAQATGEEQNKDVVELSPFEVNASNDKGYLAGSTMSGTRLNSKLEDLAASITVVTKQQLLDTAAVDINDIFLYEANTEGTGQFTDPTNDGRGIYDNVSGNPQTANRIRGLGAANIAIGGFSGNSSLPIDTYNVDAVEISRGPNTNIFGMGDASGTVNLVPSKANVTREITNITTQGDNWGGFRTTLDLNRPVFRGERSLALRFQSAYEEKGFVRKPSADRTNRWQISLTAKPFKKTTINASYESYHNFNSRPNSEPPRDTIAYWRAHGRPTWDPYTWTAKVNGVAVGTFTAGADGTLPAGLQSPGTSNARIQAIVDSGQYVFLQRGVNVNPLTAGANGGVAGPNVGQSANQRVVFSGTDIGRGGGGIFGGVATPLYNMLETTDKSIYDWTSINLAAPNYNRMRSDNYNVRLEQNILDTPRNVLAVQAEWLRQDTYEYRRSFVAQQDGVPAVLQIDTNERLIDGRPNPYFLRPFIGGNEPQIYTKPSFNDNYRAQIAYQLDLSREPGWMKWLGRHRVSGYGEYREIISAPNNLRYRDQVVDNPDFINLANVSGSNGGHLYPRYLLGSNTSDGAVQYANPGLVQPDGKFNAAYFNNTTGGWRYDDPVDIEQIYFALGMQKRKIRTTGIAIQSFLLKDRVIPTFGWRKDRSYSEDNLPLVTTNGLPDPTNLWNFGANKKWRDGPTKTKGVVVTPFAGIPALDRAAESGSGVGRFFAQALRSLKPYYNQSDSFQPADVAYNLFGEVLPNPTGKGTERGFWLSLFDDKLVLKVNKYETLQIHSRSSLGTIATRANRIDFPQGGSNDSFNLQRVATGWASTLHPEWTVAQQNAYVAQVMGLSQDFVTNVQGKTISDVNDATSKGWEFELNFNPNNYWTFKANYTKQEAIDSNLSPFIQQYIDERMPVWTSVIDPITGLNWWTEGGNSSANGFYIQNVLAPLKLAITTQGKPKPQSRGEQFNFTTKYSLAGITENRWLKNVSVGGSFRWAGRSVIGFLAGAPDADGVVRSLDGNKRVYGAATHNIDLLLSYNLRFWNDRIRTRLQLNVRNVNESGHLQPIAVNPDGTVWRYRIIDPRQFIFSASFDL